MEKKKYIVPSSHVITVVTERIVANSSLGKGDGDFDAGTMKFVKRDRSSYNVWDEDWSN